MIKRKENGNKVKFEFEIDKNKSIPHIAYIYKIKNIINNKVYIGKTERSVKTRFKEHINSVDYIDKELYNDMKKYGIKNFVVKTIDICFSKDVFDLEAYYINKYKSSDSRYGYNLTIKDFSNYEKNKISWIKYKDKQNTCIYNDIDDNILNIVEQNLLFIGDYKRMKQKYNSLYNMIKNHIEIIKNIHLFCKNKVIYSNNQYIIFELSTGDFIKYCGKGDRKNVKKYINILTFLGFIEKVNINKYLNSIFVKNNINYFKLSFYNSKILEIANKRALNFKSKNMTVKGFSRELLLRTFGKNEANRVYPRQEGKSIYEGNDRIIMILKRVALEIISLKGWMTEKELLENEIVDNRIKDEMNLKDKQKVFKQRKKKLWKICLQEFLDEYMLDRKKLNKQLIKKFNIKGVKGYPYIIYKN